MKRWMLKFSLLVAAALVCGASLSYAIEPWSPGSQEDQSTIDL